MTSRIQKNGETAASQSNAEPPRAAKTEQERRWLVENAEAIRRENESIERDGLPLAKYRLF